MKVHLGKKSLVTGIALILATTPFSSAWATSATKNIRAKLAQPITYAVDNKKITEDSTAIAYKGQTYIPIDEVSHALGYDTSIQDNQIIFTTHKHSNPDNNTKPIPNPTPTPAPTPVHPQTLNDARILAIDLGSKTITIAPANVQTDKVSNQIKLTIAPNTRLIDGKTNKTLTLDNLPTGQPVTVEYIPNTLATDNAPATGTAISVTVISQIQPK